MESDDKKPGYVDESASITKDGKTSPIRIENRTGFINEQGQFVIKPDLGECTDFSEGLAAVSKEFLIWGYIDRAGKWVITRDFVNAEPFYKGIASVGIGFSPTRYVFIDRSGKTTDDPKDFRSWRRFFSPDTVMDFSDGLFPAKRDEKWGYVNSAGNFVIPPQFERAEPFSEGYAAVSTDGEKLGYINKEGKMVIEPKYFYGILDSGFSTFLFRRPCCSLFR